MSSENNPPAGAPAAPAGRVKAHRPHGRPRYQKGCQCPACTLAGTTGRCRCTVCIAANRDYSKRDKRLRVITNGAPTEPHQPGSGYRVVRDPGELVEPAVRADLDPDKVPAAKDMPGLVAVALAMARVLDDPTSIPQHPPAAGQLLRVYGYIRAQKPAGARGSVTSLRDKRAERAAGGARA